TIQRKAVQVILAHQYGQGISNISQTDPHAGRFAAVNFHAGNGLVVVQIAVYHDEQSAFTGLLFDPLHRVVHRTVVAGAAQYQLNRQTAAGTGQGGKLEGEDTAAGNRADTSLQLTLYGAGIALALAPVLQVDPAKAGSRAVCPHNQP